MAWILKGKATARHVDVCVGSEVILKFIVGEAAFVLSGPNELYSHIITMLPVAEISLDTMFEDFYKFD